MGFPSKQFYKGKLETAEKWQRQAVSLQDFWPAGCNQPIMFVNVVGVEQTLTVATEEGSEQSKRNDKEIEQVVSVVKEEVVLDKLLITALNLSVPVAPNWTSNLFRLPRVPLTRAHGCQRDILQQQ